MATKTGRTVDPEIDERRTGEALAARAKNAGRLTVPKDIAPAQVRAYLLGAADFATGLGLDRLAKACDMAREKGESDHELALRVRARLGLHR